jgi:hypothetical protein
MERISLDFYGSPCRPAAENFAALIQILTQMSSVSQGWGFYAAYRGTLSTIFDRAGELGNLLSTQDLKERIRNAPQTVPLLFRASTAVELPISLGGAGTTEEDRYFAFDIEVFDPPFFQRIFPSQTCFASLGARPLQDFLLRADKPPELLELRTDMLLSLSAMATSVLSPACMHTYLLDSATAWPINSYMSYFSSNEQCAREINATINYWKQTRCRVQEVGSSGLARNLTETLSSARSKEQREDLRQKLESYVATAVSVTATHVAMVRSSGKFDIVDRPESGTDGFLVLDYPALLSKYIDDFIFDILHVAAEENSGGEIESG